MQNTKIVWSLDATNLKDYPPEKIRNYPYQALRLVYQKDLTQEILTFLKDYKQRDSENSSTNYKPVLLDMSHKHQACVVGLEEAYNLINKKELILVPEGREGGLQLKTDCWQLLFKEQELLYLNNGNVILKIEAVSKDEVRTSIQQGKEITNGMEVVVPSSKNPPSLFDLAYIDIKPFLELGLDYVILPGISNARELAIIRKKLASQTEFPPSLLLKVDSKEVYENMGELLPLVDGLMISRRALALSLDPATVPILCKSLIHEANKLAKITLISSDMLYSMKQNPTPTRAEVSDIANAVIDGTDAVVLSKEIPRGHNTLRALNVAAKTIEEVENSPTRKQNWTKSPIQLQSHAAHLAYYACVTAERVKAKALVCLTKEGTTAKQVASYRPNLPIIALTFHDRTKAHLSLIRGVNSIVLKGEPMLDKVLPTVKELLKKSDRLKTGDSFVFITLSLSPISGEASNLFTVQEIH